MTASSGGDYDERVLASRSGAGRWIVAGALTLCALAVKPPAAGATTAAFEVTDEAVVQVIGRAASITVRTWNRNTVLVEWPDGEPFETSRVTQRTHASFLIPTVTVTEYDTPTGPIEATLLPEDFPVPNLAPGMHDVVRIRENPSILEPGTKLPGLMHLTVTIPVSTGLVNVRSGRGNISLSDYRGTTIATIVHGRIVLRNVSGDAFVQPLNGQFYALGSDFDRLRIRSNHADQVFDNCRVKQIEATTLTGTIVFDNGAFNPGLARFESDRGSIALGVTGSAQVGAHTQDGHVLTVLPPNPPPSPVFGNGNGEGDALQLVGSGGPLVNASSIHGNVFLYDGSLTDRRPAALPPEWHPLVDLLIATRAAGRPGDVRRVRQALKLK